MAEYFKPSDEHIAQLRQEKLRQNALKHAASQGDMPAARALIDSGLRWDQAFGNKGPCSLEVAARAGQHVFLKEALCEIFGPAPATTLASAQKLKAQDPRLSLIHKCTCAAALTGKTPALQVAAAYRPLMPSTEISLGLSVVDIALKTKNPEVFGIGLQIMLQEQAPLPLRAKALFYTLDQLPSSALNPSWTSHLETFIHAHQGDILKATDARDFTPLKNAIFNGLIEWVDPLIDWGVDIKALQSGQTPLMAAVGHPSFVRKLLARGADPEQRDPQGWSAFRWALKKKQGDFESLQILWADPRSRNQWWTGADTPTQLSVLAAASDWKSHPGWHAWMIDLIDSVPLTECEKLHNNDQGLLVRMLGWGEIDICEALWAKGCRIQTPNATSKSFAGTLCRALEAYWVAGKGNDAAALRALDWLDTKGVRYESNTPFEKDLLGWAIEKKASTHLILRIQNGFDMKKRRRQGWSTMARMIHKGYRAIEDLEHVAAQGTMDEEISDWMEAVGVASTLSHPLLVTQLRARAMACREKWSLALGIPNHSEYAPTSSETLRVPRL